MKYFRVSKFVGQKSSRKANRFRTAPLRSNVRGVVCAAGLAFGLPVGLSLVTPSASAQVLYGTIAGTVTDSTGAVIPGAAVSAKQISTGLVRTTTTSAEGSYTLNDLNPGTYQVTIAAQGFTSARQENLEVLPNTAARVNLLLQAGAANQEVTVTSAPA